MTILGERLKKLRESRSYTKGFVADKLGVCKPCIYHYETGRSDISTKNLVALAKLFDVTTDYLLGIEDKPPSFKTIPHTVDILVYTGQKSPFGYTKGGYKRRKDLKYVKNDR